MKLLSLLSGKHPRCGSDRPRRGGFTLVELLVVITIIGAIAALSIPAIGLVMKNVRRAAMKAELTNLEQGIEAYYSKYGDYPPDFADWNIVKRHYLKIFPDIATSELNLLFALCDNFPDNDPTAVPPANPAYDPFVLDRAEAVVWSLGGFSSDPQYPFTGAGGPLEYLAMISGVPATNPQIAAHYQYRATRDNSFVEFEPSQLTIQPVSSVAGAVYTAGNYDRTRSTDEPVSVANLPGLYQTPDIFPTYVLREDQKPVVYFDSRTYVWNNGGTVFNGFVAYEDGVDANFITTDDLDGIRPVYTDQPNTPPTSGYTTLASSANAFEFANPRTFQLFGPGLDGNYGVLLDSNAGGPADTAPVYFQTTGKLLALQVNGPAQAVLGIDRYDITAQISDSSNRFRDNMANFIGGTFEDELP